MTRNAKRDAARDELIRLLNGLEFYRAWRIAGIKASQGEVRQEDLNAIVEPSTAFIKHFDDVGGQYGYILKTVREWYSHTYFDISLLASAGDEAASSEVRRFLTDFRNEVGFEFQSEADLVEQTVRKALKTGRITTAKDFYILKELESSVDQVIAQGSDLDAISNMLRHFENH